MIASLRTGYIVATAGAVPEHSSASAILSGLKLSLWRLLIRARRLAGIRTKEFIPKSVTLGMPESALDAIQIGLASHIKLLLVRLIKLG